MKNKRRLLLMVCSMLVLLMVAGICGNSNWSFGDVFSNEKKQEASPTPQVTDSAQATITNTPAIIGPTAQTTPTEEASVISTTPEPGTNTDLSGTPTSEPIDPTEPIESPTPTPEYFETNVILVSVNTLNVRSKASTSSSISGKIYYGCYAYVVEDLGEWLVINSGEIKNQYVFKEYTYSGYDAAKLIDDMKGCVATVTTTTNLRQGPCISEDYTKAAKKGETFTVIMTESNNEWLCLELSDYSYAYIEAEDATISFNMQTGLTNEQIRQNSFAYKLEQTLASSHNKPIESIPKTNRFTNGSLSAEVLEFYKNYTMSDLERDFFAATIMAEVGGHPYEGKLAAANVIMNRFLSRRYGNTITDVISSPWQFTGANRVMTNYKIDVSKLNAYKSRVNADCYKAVDEAFAGINNIPLYYYFHGTKAAYSSSMGYPIFKYSEFTFIGDTYFFSGYY